MKALDICWRLLNFCLIFRLPQNMENSHLLNCDENESINGNNFSDSSGIYYEKEKMALKDFGHRDSFPRGTVSTGTKWMRSLVWKREISLARKFFSNLINFVI